jgi:hypothetical protein
MKDLELEVQTLREREQNKPGRFKSPSTITFRPTSLESRKSRSTTGPKVTDSQSPCASLPNSALSNFQQPFSASNRSSTSLDIPSSPQSIPLTAVLLSVVVGDTTKGFLYANNEGQFEVWEDIKFGFEFFYFC